LPTWLVTMEYRFPDMSGAEAVARSLPVDLGPNGPEPMSLDFSLKVPADDPEHAGAIGRDRLMQQCRESGLPQPLVIHAMAWPTGRARGRQRPVRLGGSDGGGGAAGVREPRRPGPPGPPPATAYAEEPSDTES
jgi:hypothetical protein